ncbi:hypothetical protein AAMO2058_000553900 [Amorphochlora amoebiformis]
MAASAALLLSCMTIASDASLYNLTTWKEKWVIGGLANHGANNFVKQFKPTFVDYLNREVSSYFLTPISFEILPLSSTEIYTAVEKKQVDFLFCNPSIFSCLESENGIAVGATIRQLRLGHQISVSGGVIFARADRHDINELVDIEGKILEGEELSSLSGSKTQWETFFLNNISYMNWPSQLRFGHSQNNTIYDVLSGKVDIGLIRTDLLEEMKTEGKINIDDIKIIHHVNYTVDQHGFPFELSTHLYPEWPFSILEHTDWQVSQHVVEALMRIDETMNQSIIGGYATWQAPLSYKSLRDLHEDLKWIYVDKAHNHLCRRSNELYEAIHCPDGYLKKTKDEVDLDCKIAESQNYRYHCPDNYDCICHPCYEIIIDLTDFEPEDQTIYFYAIFGILPILALILYITIKRKGNNFKEVFNQLFRETLWVAASLVMHLFDLGTDIYSYTYILATPELESFIMPYSVFLVLGGTTSLIEIWLGIMMLRSLLCKNRSKYEGNVDEMQILSQRKIVMDDGHEINLSNKKAVELLISSTKHGIVVNMVSIFTAMFEDAPFMVINAMIIMKIGQVDMVLVLSMLMNAFIAGTVVSTYKNLMQSMHLHDKFNDALRRARTKRESTNVGSECVEDKRATSNGTAGDINTHTKRRSLSRHKRHVSLPHHSIPIALANNQKNPHKVSIEGVVVGAPTPGDTPSTTLRTVQSPLTVVNRSSVRYCMSWVCSHMLYLAFLLYLGIYVSNT